MAKITFVMDEQTKNKLDYIRSKDKDNRSIQKELEWLISERYTEMAPDSTHKNNTDNQVKPRTVSEYLKDVETHKNNTVSKPEPFKSFPKGGGKK